MILDLPLPLLRARVRTICSLWLVSHPLVWVCTAAHAYCLLARAESRQRAGRRRAAGRVAPQHATRAGEKRRRDPSRGMGSGQRLRDSEQLGFERQTPFSVALLGGVSEHGAGGALASRESGPSGGDAGGRGRHVYGTQGASRTVPSRGACALILSLAYPVDNPDISPFLPTHKKLLDSTHLVLGQGVSILEPPPA